MQRSIITLAAAVLLLALNGQAKADLAVNYSSDASSSLTADLGDQFFLNGLGGSVNLAPGVASDVDIIAITQDVGNLFDSNLYQNTVDSTLTLNGVGGAFSQTWSVYDNYAPNTDLSAYGPVVYNVPGGTITATAIDSGFQDIPVNEQVSLLYTPTAVPAPSIFTTVGIGAVCSLAYFRRKLTQSDSAAKTLCA